MVNCLSININHIKEAIRICLIQDFEADFLWKVSLKILNSGIILKTFQHESLFYDFSQCADMSHSVALILLDREIIEDTLANVCYKTAISQ